MWECKKIGELDRSEPYLAHKIDHRILWICLLLVEGRLYQRSFLKSFPAPSGKQNKKWPRTRGKVNCNSVRCELLTGGILRLSGRTLPARFRLLGGRITLAPRPGPTGWGWSWKGGRLRLQTTKHAVIIHHAWWKVHKSRAKERRHLDCQLPNTA